MRALLAALALAAPAAAAPKPTKFAPKVPATLELPLPGDAAGVSVHRLPNGLTVYLSPDRSIPRVATRLAIRAGGKHDPADSTGMAHYLEHMLVFKGSARLGTVDYQKEKPHLDRIRALYDKLFKTKGEAERAAIYKEIDRENVEAAKYASASESGRLYRAIGGRALNAHTAEERTIYEVDVPANRLEAWAAVTAEQMKGAVFRLFQTEIEAVYEEKNRSLDNPEFRMWEEMERLAFKSHPYGQSIIGSVEHLKNPSLSKMYAFYERWYVPNNAAVALAGDFDRAQALALVEKHFGSWQPRELPAPSPAQVPPLKGEETREFTHEAEEKVMVAWAMPAHSHPDADAVAVMDMIVDNAAAGLLNLRLNQAQKVKASGSYPSLRNDAGLWTMWAAPKAGQTLEEAKALLLEAAEWVKAGDFEPADVEAVITAFEVSKKKRLEDNEDRAEFLAQSFTKLEEWQRAADELERLRKVRKEDVVRVARKYLGPNRAVVLRRVGKPEIPKIVKPEFTKVAIDPSRSSELLKSLLALPAAPIEPRWLVSGRDYSVLPIAGGRLYAAKNPHNDLFALELRVDRGWRHERRLCEALSLLGLSGAGPYSAEEFKKRLFALGTTVSHSCGERESSIHLEGLDRNLWPSLELLTQRLDWPNVSSGTLQRMVEVELGAREDEKRDPSAVHRALGELAKRGRDSAVLGRLSNAELKALDEGTLKSIIRDYPSWQKRVGYVGPRTAGEIAKLLDAPRRLKAAPPSQPLRYLKSERPRVLFTHRDMVQAQIGLYSPTAVFDAERTLDYLFYTQYMGGGLSSVIFQEVRESRALAYHAAGGHELAAEKGDELGAWGFVGCQADKTPEALSLMQNLFADFPSSEHRFRDIRRSVEEHYRTNPTPFRAVPASLMSWEDQGITGGDPRPKRFERALKYELKDLEAFAAGLKKRPMAAWVLGHRDRVGLDKLKALGDFEEKPLDALFPY